MFLECPTFNAQAMAELEIAYPNPYFPRTRRHELSKNAADAASPVPAKGEQVQSGFWNSEQNLITVTSEHKSTLTAYIFAP